MMNITEITSPIPSFSGAMFKNSTRHTQSFLTRLAAIFFTTQDLLMREVFLSQDKFLIYSLRASLPTFLDTHVEKGYPHFIWGDVLKGIEELSHNVTASLLTMPFGTMITDCEFYHHDVVYQYSSVALWVPYGVSHFSLLSCYDLTISPLCFIDSLGHYFIFTHCCRHDNGEQSHWRYHYVIFGYSHFNAERGCGCFSRRKVEAESSRRW
jgi:hypothetical protein